MQMYFSDYASFNSQTVDFQKVVTFSLKTTLQEMEVKKTMKPQFNSNVIRQTSRLTQNKLTLSQHTLPVIRGVNAAKVSCFNSLHIYRRSKVQKCGG